LPLLDNIKIPKERIAVVIGKNGAVKKKIEQLTGMALSVESATGNVFFEQTGKKQADFLSALNIVKAIGRGFSPENAFLLLDEENFLQIIDLTEFGKTKKRLSSRRGRVIGTEGKIRKRIEDETETKISIFGKTISIIGKIENIEIAKKAVEMIVQGARHTSVFDFIRESSLSERKFEL
jgi:ribosomal RNA assembly protein